MAIHGQLLSCVLASGFLVLAAKLRSNVADTGVDLGALLENCVS